MMRELFLILSVTSAIVAAVAGWTFVYLYWHEKWRYLEAGRHLMHFTFGLAVAITWILLGVPLRYIWGDVYWLEVVLGIGRTVIFVWLAWMLIQRTRLLQKAIRTRKELERHGRDH